MTIPDDLCYGNVHPCDKDMIPAMRQLQLYSCCHDETLTTTLPDKLSVSALGKHQRREQAPALHEDIHFTRPGGRISLKKPLTFVNGFFLAGVVRLERTTRGFGVTRSQFLQTSHGVK